MAKRKPLVCQHLEGISGTALERYQAIIRDYVRGRHGIYALYRREKLYYVGLASNLRGRLNTHLKDRHAGRWDRFSVYLTIGDAHLRELESLVLCIVRPQGNRQVGRFAKSENLRTRLARDIRASHRLEVETMLGLRRALANPAPESEVDVDGRVPILAKYNDGRILKLRVRFGGKLIRARVRRDGQIRCNGRLYASPSKAASAVCKRPCNGWTFWRYERAPGDWVALDELRR